MNIEQEIQENGLTAPRVTPQDIDDNIVGEAYFTAYDGLMTNYSQGKFKAGYADSIDALRVLTLCVLVLKNGFTVTGESACASPENFNAEIGRKIARTNALEKIWPLMGYELKCRLSA